jgi:hypothetical protein
LEQHSITPRLFATIIQELRLSPQRKSTSTIAPKAFVEKARHGRGLGLNAFGKECQARWKRATKAEAPRARDHGWAVTV